VLFGVAFFFINIVLVLQLVTVGTAVMAERYTYLPYIGLFFALSWWLDERGSGKGVPWRTVLAAYLLLLAPLSLAQTWKRSQVWHDPETFWTDAIQKHPGQIVAAYTNRGNYYRRAGRLEEARRDYDQALAMNPRIASNWYNQAVVLARLGSEDSAVVALGRAIDLEPRDVRAWNDRGAIRMKRGDTVGAVGDFTRAIELDPRSWNAYANRALAFEKLGDQEKALADRRKADSLERK
jgi:protein O-mannosyl-transferase